MPMLVLAGGFGTRLRSAVGNVPKPMAPVDAHPFLGYLIESWTSQGLRDFVFLLHHQAELIQGFLETRKDSPLLQGCTVRSVVEGEALGTGGAVAHAVKELSLTGSLLVSNGDTWLDTGINEVTAARAPAMAVIRVDDAGRYGSVSPHDGLVATFNEKSQTAGEGWINAGLYHLNAGLFEGWAGQPFSLERDLFPGLARNHQLRAVAIESSFIDIGIPEEYFRFCRWVETGKSGAL